MAAKHATFGIGTGFVVGACLTGFALQLYTPESVWQHSAPLHWIDANLGASVWLLVILISLFLADLNALRALLSQQTKEPLDATQTNRISALDQRLDVWSHLFIGIGVIWTAIGMRSALQATLGEGPSQGAASVLQSLVDGGILLALSTTIVGGVGGYAMRLTKTLMVGQALQAHYESMDNGQVRKLIEATERIESRLAS